MLVAFISQALCIVDGWVPLTSTLFSHFVEIDGWLILSQAHIRCCLTAHKHEKVVCIHTKSLRSHKKRVMSHCLSTLQAPSILTKKFDTTKYYQTYRFLSQREETAYSILKPNLLYCEDTTNDRMADSKRQVPKNRPSKMSCLRPLF